MTGRRFTPLLAAVLAVAACGHARERGPGRAAAARPAPASSPRWFVTERAAAILDEALAPRAEPRDTLLDGTRVSLRSGALVAAHPSAERLRGYRALGAQRGYVFWSSARTFLAPAFEGELRTLVDTPASGGVRPWLGGVLLRTEAGPLELDASSQTLRRCPFVGLADAIAIDARRAARVDALGRVHVTVDGGGTWLDLEATRGFVADALRAGVSGAIELHPPMGAGLELGPSGDVRPPREAPRAFRTFTASRTLAEPAHGLASAALAEAMTFGVPLDGDRALVGRPGGLRLVSTASGHLIDDRDLPPIDDHAATACQAVRVGDELLAVCARERHAVVFSLADGIDGVRTESTFDGAVFVAGPGARFGHAGPCGPARPAPAVPDRDATEPRHPTPPEPEARYCARLPGGRWVERVLRGADAAHLVRWIPGEGATVTVLVVGDAPAAAPSADGIRVVRLAPAKGILAKARLRAPRTDGAVPLVDVDAWEETDGAIRAWSIPTAGPIAPVRIDRRGGARELPLPAHVTRVAANGPFAVASAPAHDGVPARRFESIDGGASFREIAPPPGGLDGLLDDATGCGPLGCAWESGLVRVGWGPGQRSAPPVAAPPGKALHPSPARMKRAKIVCRVSSGDASRSPSAPLVALVPPSVRQAPKAGSVDVATPFDPRAAPRHLTLPKELAVDTPGTIPVLGVRGVDLLLFGHARAVRGLGGAAGALPFDVEGRPGIAAEAPGALVVLDPDRAVVDIARPSGVAPVARLVHVPDVTRLRLTLARRLDADGLAIAGYSAATGEVWAGALDLARGEVAPLVALGSLDVLVGADRCPARPRTHRLLLELPIEVRLEGARTDELATTATVLAVGGDGLLCAEALEARVGADVLVARLDARGDAAIRRDTAGPLGASCTLSP